MTQKRTKVMEIYQEPYCECEECGDEIEQCDRCDSLFEDGDPIICVGNEDCEHICIKCNKKKPKCQKKKMSTRK